MEMKAVRRLLSLTFLCLGAACSQQEPSGAKPEARAAGDPVKFLSAKLALEISGGGAGQKNIELSPTARMQIKRGPDYVPIAIAGTDSQPLFDRLEGSMAERRAAAWQIVEKMLAPQKLTLKDKDGKEEIFDVPLWHTWYEGPFNAATGGDGNGEANQLITGFIAALKECRDDKTCKDSPEKREELAEKVVANFTGKAMATSLTANNMERTLGQFADKDGNNMAAALGSPHLGQGFTLFSPSFMVHVLAQAQGVEQCGDASHSPKAVDAPPSADQFSPCIKEFPRSAVMVKTSWSQIDGTTALPLKHDTSSATLGSQLGKIGGGWPQQGSPATPTTNNIYAVQADNGNTYGLNAIHFSTKDTREWIWVTLWWDPQPNLDFGADRPKSIASFNGGVWANYKMCVTTAFNEGDAAPRKTFEASAPTLAASLKSSHDAIAAQVGEAPFDTVTSWCSNPNVERHPNNDKTNCIGCHQYSMTAIESPGLVGLPSQNPKGENQFSDTIWLARQPRLKPVTGNDLKNYRLFYPQLGRSRIRKNFPADFAWSTSMEFRSQIFEARDGKFEW